MNTEEYIKYLTEREFEKLKEVFDSIKFVGKEKEIWNLVISYWNDCKYFYEKGDMIKAFELVNYIWGMLDILGNLKLLKIPEEIKKWFKI